MSNPWHGEIAALSPLYLIRDNVGETWGSSGRRAEVGEGRGLDGEVEEKGGWEEERYKVGGWESEKWRL